MAAVYRRAAEVRTSRKRGHAHDRQNLRRKRKATGWCAKKPGEPSDPMAAMTVSEFWEKCPTQSSPGALHATASKPTSRHFGATSIPPSVDRNCARLETRH